MLWWFFATVSVVMQGPSLQDYLEMLARRNPHLQRVGHEIEALQLESQTATAWPDPTLNVDLMAQPVETRVGPQRQRFGVSQVIPDRGRLVLAEEVAKTRVAETDAQRAHVLRRLEREFRKGFADYYYTGRALVVTGDFLRLLDSLSEVVAAKYRAGDTAYANLIRTEIEIDRAQNRLLALRSTAQAQQARLNALLGREPTTVIAFPESAEAFAATPSVAEIEAHPELAALAQVSSRFDALAAMAERRERRPDVRVGLDWINTSEARTPGVPGSGDDPLIVKLGVQLPVSRRVYRAQAGAARARSLAVDAAARDARIALNAQAAEARFALEDAEREIRLHRDVLIPKGEDAFAVILSAFESDAAGFQDVVDVERELLDLRLAEHRATAARGRAVADLIYFYGEPGGGS